MPRYHLNANHEPRLCKAKTPDKCRFYVSKTDTRHHIDYSSAVVASEELLAAEYGGSKLGAGAKKPEETYSVLDELDKRETIHKVKYAGYNDVFFKTNLRHNLIADDIVLPDLIDNIEKEKALPESLDSLAYRDLAGKLFCDMSNMSDRGVRFKEVEQIGEDLGAKVSQLSNADLRKITSDNSEVGWVFSFDNGKHLLVTDKQHSQLQAFHAKDSLGDAVSVNDQIVRTDIRSLVANKRIEKLSGRNLLVSIATDDIKTQDSDKDSTKEYKAKLATLKTLRAIEQSQLEGKAFEAQRKYAQEHSKAKNPTAQVKPSKNVPDKKRQEMMKTTKLKERFRKVEIDNNVDKEDWDEFEPKINKVLDKLPRQPKDRRVGLKVSKLKKKNTHGDHSHFAIRRDEIAVDPKNPNDFIYDVAHHYDMVVKENASLSPKFAGISDHYLRALKSHNDSLNPTEKEALETPAEQFARGFEVYAREKLGVDKEFVNSENFDRYDYAPFNDDKSLKKKLFSFFDDLFSKDFPAEKEEDKETEEKAPKSGH